MRNSKLHKYLKQEVKELFDTWLNGELLRTKNEIKDYCDQLSDIPVEDIRFLKEEMKLKTKDQIN